MIRAAIAVGVVGVWMDTDPIVCSLACFVLPENCLTLSYLHVLDLDLVEEAAKPLSGCLSVW
jgi:hypothetical protein